MTTLTTPPGVAAELSRIAAGNHGDPHRVLGVHEQDDRWVMRAWLPGAASCVVVVDDEGDRRRVAAIRPSGGPAGSFVADLGPAGPPAEARPAANTAGAAEASPASPASPATPATPPISPLHGLWN